MNGIGSRIESPPRWSTRTNMFTATSAAKAPTQATETPASPLLKAWAGLPDLPPRTAAAAPPTAHPTTPSPHQTNRMPRAASPPADSFVPTSGTATMPGTTQPRSPNAKARRSICLVSENGRDAHSDRVTWHRPNDAA
jgi:hypothetical protein